MALFLLAFTALAHWADYPAAMLLVRCGLVASNRFSPRAAIALSSLVGLVSALTGLLSRRGLRAVPGAQRSLTAIAAFVGGVLGRSFLLMWTARFPGSLELARMQSIPLLLMSLFALIPRPLSRCSLQEKRGSYIFLCTMTSILEGFFGAGGLAVYAMTCSDAIRRAQIPATALLTLLCAQAGALLLTFLCGAAMVFPFHMLLMTCAGAALGALFCEAQKKRGAALHGMRIALKLYLLLAALSCLEQSL